MLRARPGAAARLRQRLAAEADARLLGTADGGQVLIAEFDAALRDRVKLWPQVALVGAITVTPRTLRRIRVDQAGNRLPSPQP